MRGVSTPAVLPVLLQPLLLALRPLPALPLMSTLLVLEGVGPTGLCACGGELQGESPCRQQLWRAVRGRGMGGMGGVLSGKMLTVSVLVLSLAVLEEWEELRVKLRGRSLSTCVTAPSPAVALTAIILSMDRLQRGLPPFSLLMLTPAALAGSVNLSRPSRLEPSAKVHMPPALSSFFSACSWMLSPRLRLWRL